MPIIVPEGTDKQDEDPTDAQVPVTDAERDRWRRIVAAQRKDISDLARQLSLASIRASYWETLAGAHERPGGDV